jgi:hypothetical protein
MTPEVHIAFADGERAPGENPASTPVFTETFVVVGDEAEARAGTETSHLPPKSSKPGVTWIGEASSGARCFARPHVA